MDTAIAGGPVSRSAIQAKKFHLPELDGLRGMAILFVLLYHCFSLSDVHSPLLKSVFAMGWSGVDLFFVLSGFLIGGILLDAKESPNYFKTFYERRAFRIMPLYYVWIGVYFLAAAFLGNTEGWRSVPVYVLFLQNSIKINHSDLGLAWLGHLWSLSVEEQFYLVIPFAIRFLKPSRLVPVLCLTIVTVPMARVFLHLNLTAHPAAQYMLTMCRADALAIGVLLAITWRNEVWKAKLCSHRGLIFGILVLLTCAFLYLAIWNASQYSLTMAAWGFSVVDAFFAGVLLIAVMRPVGMWAAVCRWSLLTELGRISYCLYLVHPVFILLCRGVLLRQMPESTSYGLIGASALGALLACGLATLSLKFFEQPMLRRGHEFKY